MSYLTLPLTAKVAILNGFLSALEQPTPRDKLSCSIGLILGLTGIEPNGVSFEDAVAAMDVQSDISAICDECADAVLEVLARHGARFREST